MTAASPATSVSTKQVLAYMHCSSCWALSAVAGQTAELTVPSICLHAHISKLALLQVLLLVVPGSAKASQVDEAGLSSLAVLRLMGLPALQVVVQGQAEASMKERSAAKKRAQAAVASQVHARMPKQSCANWQRVACTNC